MGRTLVNASSWPKKYSCRFIEPGLVHYDEYGNVLVRKEVLDKMARSFVGKPVINETHMDVTPEMFEEVADGVITDVRYEKDGWFWADFVVWDESTQRNCESKAYSVSCAYDVTDFQSVKGEHNNIPYEQEVLDGQYTHLAVVANPRYEDARIVVYNSKGGSTMFNLWKKGKKDVKNSISEADLKNTKVSIDNAEVPLSELVETFKQSEDEKRKLMSEKLDEDSIIEIDGNEIPMKNLMDCYRSSKSRKNAEDEDKKKKDEEAKNAADDEAKKKKEADDEKAENADKDNKEMCNGCQNSVPKKETVVRDEKKLCNACAVKADEEAKQHFDKLRNAANRRGEPQTVKVKTQSDRLVEGRSKYGIQK